MKRRAKDRATAVQRCYARGAWLGFLALLLCGVPHADAEILPVDGVSTEAAAPDADPSSLLPPDDADDTVPLPRPELVPDRQEDAITALSDAMRENAAIKDILRDMLPMVQSAQAEDAPEPGSDLTKPVRLASATPQDRSGEASDRPATNLDSSIIEVDNGDGGLTARQVLQSIAPSAAARRGLQASADGTLDGEALDDGTDPATRFLPNLTNLVLDSRFLGDILGSVISVDSIDDTFSVLGFGKFEFGYDPGDSSLMLKDLSGSSSFATDAPQEPDPMAGMPRAPDQKIDFLGLALSYLETPTGIMVSIFAGAVLLLLTTFRALARPRG